MRHVAAAEEVGDVAFGGVEGQVSEVGRIRRFRGHGKLLADGEATVGWRVARVSAGRTRGADEGLPKLAPRSVAKPPPKPLLEAYEGLSPP